VKKEGAGAKITGADPVVGDPVPIADRDPNLPVEPKRIDSVDSVV
jgi:hypothetical protein